MNKGINLKNTSWNSAGRVAKYAGGRPDYGIVNGKGQFLSTDGVKPCAFHTMHSAKYQAPYADDFKGHVWVQPITKEFPRGQV